MSIEKEIDNMLDVMEEEFEITSSEYKKCKDKLNSYGRKRFKEFRNRLSSLIKKIGY